MADFNVSNAAELTTALSSAGNGDTIILADGSYGNYTVNNETGVTIRGGVGAEFERLTITNCDSCIFHGFKVVDKVAGSETERLVDVYSSADIQLVNLTVEGPELQSPEDSAERDNLVYDSHQGISLGSITGNVNTGLIVVAGCNIQKVEDAIWCFNNEDVILYANVIDNIGKDAISFGSADNILIQNNWNAVDRWPEIVGGEPDHKDFIQGQAGTTGNVVCRGNFSGGQKFQTNCQGIFIDDGTFQNVLMEQNIHIGGYLNGMKVEDGVASNVWSWRNTSLTPVSWGAKAAQITGAVGSGSSTGNVTGWNNNNKSLSGANIVIQTDEPAQSGYYADYYANVTGATGQEPLDFEPVPGSLTDPDEATHYGAAERIREINHGTPFTYPAVPFTFSLDPSMIDPLFTDPGNPFSSETPPKSVGRGITLSISVA